MCELQTFFPSQVLPSGLWTEDCQISSYDIARGGASLKDFGVVIGVGL